MKKQKQFGLYAILSTRQPIFSLHQTLNRIQLYFVRIPIPYPKRKRKRKVRRRVELVP